MRTLRYIYPEEKGRRRATRQAIAPGERRILTDATSSELSEERDSLRLGYT